MAAFVIKTTYEDLSAAAIAQLKIRVLDALGCAIGAIDQGVMQQVHAHAREFDRVGPCTLIGGGRAAPDRAAFYNAALVRYLDFNDSYLAKNETCHPSDNLGAVMAACEYADRSGQDLLLALATAYQVQCRLSDVAPVRAKGFDHTTQGSYAVAAGVSKGLGLDAPHTANAVAICGTAFNALRVTRTGALSNWKGLAYPNTAFCATHATLLAQHGITGPLEVFEGNKGFMEAISGPFEIDWEKEDLERVTETIVKRYNAEVHSQSAIEGILELRARSPFPASAVERIDLEIFDVAFNIIGGGEEGDKMAVHSKEEADHSLPYLIAVALLDSEVMPAQYSPERIRREDVQALLRKVHVKAKPDLSERFPKEMPCRLSVRLSTGETLSIEKSDYAGFLTRPATWEVIADKFKRLSTSSAAPWLQDQIVEIVGHLEKTRVRRLTQILQRAQTLAEAKGEDDLAAKEAPRYGGT